MMEKKIVLFGGTFDPIHVGHTRVASCALEHLGAEKIIFVPAKRSPLKTSFPRASNDNRMNMISLAIADNEKFDVSDYELKKSVPSYTLETVKHFQSTCGGDSTIYWLAGADSVSELPHWYGITELLDRCRLSVMYRAGCEAPDFTKFSNIWGPDRIERLQRNIIKTPLIDVSSTEIRKRLAAGGDVSDMLAPVVLEYISKHNLYGATANGTDESL